MTTISSPTSIFCKISTPENQKIHLTISGYVALQIPSSLDQNGNFKPEYSTAIVNWFNSLPTELPIQSGIVWNNFGTICKS